MPVKIQGVNEHARIRNVTLEQAQQFIDEAVIMFDQATAYTKEDFDPAILAVLAIVGMIKDE